MNIHSRAFYLSSMESILGMAIMRTGLFVLDTMANVGTAKSMQFAIRRGVTHTNNRYCCHLYETQSEPVASSLNIMRSYCSYMYSAMLKHSIEMVSDIYPVSKQQFYIWRTIYFIRMPHTHVNASGDETEILWAQ